jgi:hypothetical protein
MNVVMLNVVMVSFLGPSVDVLTHKHCTRVKRLAMDKHSNLIQTFVNYGRKKLTLGPGRT